MESRRSQDQDRSRRSDHEKGQGHHRDMGHSSDRRSRSRSRGRSRGRSVADNIVLQAEHFKATIDPPTGRETGHMAGANDMDSLSNNIKELLTILKNNSNVTEPDTDDDFFHITCHVEPTLRSKIAHGEFVDLEKLLPKNRAQMMAGATPDGDIEVVKKNGATYILPEASSKDMKITNVRKWEQAFRVYSAIYSEANPDRAAEIWQYVHVINTAAMSYAWENVAFYDVTFRQLMDKSHTALGLKSIHKCGIYPLQIK